MTEGGVVGNVGAAVSVVPSVILDLIVLRNRFFGPRRGGERLRGAVATQPTLPYRIHCAVLASLSVFDFLPRQAGEARRGQGPPEAASLKLQPIGNGATYTSPALNPGMIMRSLSAYEHAKSQFTHPHRPLTLAGAAKQR